MLSGMTGLKAQSEITERRALESLHRACPPELARRLGLELLEAGGAFLSCCRADPSILLNRAVGLGIDSPATPQTISTVTEAFREREIDDYFFHLYDDALTPDCRRAMNAAGLHRRRGWMKFVNTAPAGRDVKSSLSVERVTPATANDFAAIVCSGFGLNEGSVPLIAALVDDERWQLFLSRDGTQPAGAGGLFVDGPFGWLDWAATLPEFRCRGSQSAIMAARLDLAASLGCEAVFTETGEAVDGDPQHSYGNIERAGFKKIGPRSNYSPRPAP